MNSKEPKLLLNQWGFYQYSPMPDDETLRAYYSEKYYQEGCGSYEQEYSAEELRWKELKNWLIAERSIQLHPKAKQILDIGCGEGCLIAEFFKRGLSPTGFDFSSDGIQKLHPQMLPHFKQGNIFELLENDKTSPKYDIICCTNVIEHVTSPVELMAHIDKILSENGIIAITAPNDFSELHHNLSQNKITRDNWWVKYPDHLSYFNKFSMNTFLEDNGFKIITTLSDNPIDLNLLNETSNYIETPELGSCIHKFRIKTDLFLASIDRHKLLKLYEAYGDMGVGRNLTYYAKRST